MKCIVNEPANLLTQPPVRFHSTTLCVTMHVNAFFRLLIKRRNTLLWSRTKKDTYRKYSPDFLKKIPIASGISNRCNYLCQYTGPVCTLKEWKLFMCSCAYLTGAIAHTCLNIKARMKHLLSTGMVFWNWMEIKWHCFYHGGLIFVPPMMTDVGNNSSTDRYNK